MTDRQRNGFVLLIVLGLLIGSLIVIAGVPGAVKSKKTVLGLDLKGGVELVYQGLPSAQTKTVTQDALQRAVDIMRNPSTSWASPSRRSRRRAATRSRSASRT